MTLPFKCVPKLDQLVSGTGCLRPYFKMRISTRNPRLLYADLTTCKAKVTVHTNLMRGSKLIEKLMAIICDGHED